MPQLFVNASNGHVTDVLPDGRDANSNYMRWPFYVRLLVDGDPNQALDAARNADTRKVFVNLDALSDEQLALLSIEDVIEIDLADLKLGGFPISAQRLGLATEGREAERAAFEAFRSCAQNRKATANMPKELREHGFKNEARALEKAQRPALAILHAAEAEALRALNVEAERVKKEGKPTAEAVRAMIARTRGVRRG
jgi:hypothetical protein